MKDSIKNEMVKILMNQKFTTFKCFASKLNLSLSTTKRYCKELEADFYLQIVRGGVKSLNFNELSNIKKRNINLHGKQIIAKKAVALIEKNDTIFLDAGTTTMEIAKILPVNKNIVIFTNNIDIIPFLSDKNITTYLIGGRVNYNTTALTGDMAMNIINSIQFNIAFLGCNGYDKKFIYTTNWSEAFLKRTVISNSLKFYFLADKTKENKRFSYKVLAIKDAQIIK